MVFDANFVAMKVGIYSVRGFRNNMRMMGTYLYGDTIYVIHNTQRSESISNNRSTSIYCHKILESIAVGDFITAMSLRY